MGLPTTTWGFGSGLILQNSRTKCTLPKNVRLCLFKKAQLLLHIDDQKWIDGDTIRRKVEKKTKYLLTN